MSPESPSKRPELLEDPVEFWDRRHAAFDSWRSGGDRGLTVAENQEFYARRLGQVLTLITRHTSGERYLRVLDAGCGRGHLAAGLSRCGHVVHGIDSSTSAIDWARANYPGSFECAALGAHRPNSLYDVVVCMDVLFHVLDDDVWRDALAAFARYARAEAVIIIADSFGDTRFIQGDYIVHREAAVYDDVLRRSDFRRVETVPYAFGSNPNQFAVYRRTI